MRVAHFDCFSGISGDMTLAALFDLGVDVDAVRVGLGSLNLPIQLHVEKIRKGGFSATQVRIEAPHEHKHRHLHHIEEILNGGQLTDRQRELALAVFRRLAQAEATVHGIPVEKVHFHEVGALDSIADIAGAAIALDSLAVERITSAPVPTGSGMVQCEHGMMPIPAPATAELLKGAPLRPSIIHAELTTPTGAAILTTIVDEWIATPAMTIEGIGCGAGRMDFNEQPNVLRIFVGTADIASAAPPPSAQAHGSRCLAQSADNTETDTIWVVETNLDDLPAEIIGYCCDRLLDAGALDVFTTPVFMKKNRPGVLITVLCSDESVAQIEGILFQETATFGLRRRQAQRNKLQRQSHTVQTTWGPIEGKLGWRDGQPAVFTPEYDDCARIARASGVPLREVYFCALNAFQEETDNPR